MALPAAPKTCIDEAVMAGLIVELAGWMKKRKKYWLIPLILALLLVGTLIVVASATSVSPFIYPLF
jgi:hypothetical protein